MEIKKGIFFLFLSSNFMKHRRNIHRSVWKLLAYRLNSKWRYHGNRDTNIMGRGDVRYCFAMAILVYYCHGILYQFDWSISSFPSGRSRSVLWTWMWSREHMLCVKERNNDMLENRWVIVKEDVHEIIPVVLSLHCYSQYLSDSYYCCNTFHLHLGGFRSWKKSLKIPNG